MDAAPQLPVAADWFSLTWVTGRTAVLTEPHMDELLRAGLWYLRGRDRDLLVDTGNGVGALAPVLARLARGGRPREIVCVVHARAHRPHRRLPRVRAAAAAPGGAGAGDARPQRRAAGARRAGRRSSWPSSPRAASCRRRVLVDAVPYPGFDPTTFRPERAAPTHLVRGGDEIDLGDRRFTHRRPARAHAGQHRAHRPRGARPHLRRRDLRRRAHRHAAGVGRRDLPADDGGACAGSTSTSCTPGTAGRSTAPACASSPRSTCASAAAERRGGRRGRRLGYSSPTAQQRDGDAGAARRPRTARRDSRSCSSEVAEQHRHRAALRDDHRRDRQRPDGDRRGERDEGRGVEDAGDGRSARRAGAAAAGRRAAAPPARARPWCRAGRRRRAPRAAGRVASASRRMTTANRADGEQRPAGAGGARAGAPARRCAATAGAGSGASSRRLVRTEDLLAGAFSTDASRPPATASGRPIMASVEQRLAARGSRSRRRSRRPATPAA